ncbi:ATP-binding cassette subfamily B protein [Vagococcus fluvialis]|uniref:ABC transporter n=1 Tax=Vagococcus fluvialis TaxID=2738 RepID=A0A369AW24_9ENTE|nr:ABC transporter ATP-binding protein [Vagococcus fluvialis]MBO0480449.1 ABC transporter ATP-binding protein [Vagococcus fluvialis]MBO0485591.1 ABC transporter ATP-binding protein [Vagococcus fluvialis]RCX12456.1 ATP-binding cassette subfamily B protein [Vagococcus fluvialis]RSU00927.1 ABC transporter [Vagococcus fluvialis]UDM75126.1 ABC transporter ATP-binding protein/permease [Vagococcus fluvialis]
MTKEKSKKKNNFSGNWKKLIAYSKRYMPIIIIALIASMIGSVLTLIGPDKLSEITDLITQGIMTGIDLDEVKRIGILLVFFYGFGSLLSIIQGFIMASVTQIISRNLREDISKKINRLPLAYFNRNSTGDVLSRVTNDVDTIGQTLNQSIGTLVSAITLLFGSLFMMLKTNVTLTATAVGATIIGFVLMSLIMSKSQKYFSQQQNDLGRINSHVEEIYTGQSVVKIYNAEESNKKVFDEMNESLKTSGFKAQCLSGLMMPIMQFIGNFGYVAVCIVGAVLANNGTISFGVIVAFILYVRYFTQPLSQIAQSFQSLQSTSAASKRVFEFLGEEEMSDESHKEDTLDKATGEVSFNHVSFGYTPEKKVIKDFSAEVKPGQKIAIVGPTGAGKTTLINLLMRFYEVDSGDIKIDGIKTKDLPRHVVNNQFSMILQDTWLFEGTIKENIVYNMTGITEEEIQKACESVGIHHFIETLPEKYDTILNDQLSLSSGQKQQLTIARAIVDNKPMLILDEATSSVDTRTEIQIQSSMDQLMENRTSFIIAHRLSTIRNADVILVMKDGDIIEQGNHDDLIAQNGFYSELYNSQFEEKIA